MIALASDVKVTTTDKVVYGQTPPETDSPPATNSSEDTQSPASRFLSNVNCDVRVTLRSAFSGPFGHVRTANIRKVAGVMMLNVDNRETWLPLQWTRPNSNGVGLKEPTPRTCQANWQNSSLLNSVQRLVETNRPIHQSLSYITAPTRDGEAGRGDSLEDAEIFSN